jgi:hypothetical protein
VERADAAPEHPHEEHDRERLSRRPMFQVFDDVN